MRNRRGYCRYKGSFATIPKIYGCNGKKKAAAANQSAPNKRSSLSVVISANE